MDENLQMWTVEITTEISIPALIPNHYAKHNTQSTSGQQCRCGKVIHDAFRFPTRDSMNKIGETLILRIEFVGVLLDSVQTDQSLEEACSTRLYRTWEHWGTTVLLPQLVHLVGHLAILARFDCTYELFLGLAQLDGPAELRLDPPHTIF